MHSLSPQQKSPSGIAASTMYSQTSSDLTYQHLLQIAVEIINAGYQVIVDATFLQQQQRELFSKQAEQLQVPFLIINTRTDKHTLIQRIKDRARQQSNVSEADPMVLEMQLQNMQALSDEETKIHKNC